jgi:serralysin
MLFDTSAYLAVNKDVAAAGINPLDHYHQSGWREGRDPGLLFDTKLYLLNNPDVAAAGVDPFEHYLTFGRFEIRSADFAIGEIKSCFDAQWYLFHYDDVAAAGVDPFLHYQTSGWREGRNPNGFFDTSLYLLFNQDVAAAIRSSTITSSAGRKAAIRGEGSTPLPIWRRIPMSRLPASTRSSIS